MIKQPEERPQCGSLGAISAPARAVGVNELMHLGSEEGRETPLVQIEATPEELRPCMGFHIRQVIEHKIEHGELERVNGGEK